ncbi:uncharacterized protein PHACADRAFT_251021 [Phanerochaete carnosa HHB-10118-sp]|uniref:Uncharacterized protein n=1 Tax=Phanerochaete carnosa (strain HHB-10118-sp) TaxID=650164 RepID=K5WL24_PHACS|nr:uncharacterized protein PHACADRAFT_251021 [Phanerochaete carnosa HHB-10118-sp]EKM60125.1 hypothetical protein PHACADRAFT_251021 [Phanerochaete carnosa HHB-10118-sp]
MTYKRGHKFMRGCDAYYETVFSAMSTMPEPAGATAVATSAFTPRLKAHTSPTARS